MDRSAVKAIVDREVEPMMGRLGIAHWEVTVGYDLRDGEGSWQVQGRCRTRAAYNSSTISLDPDALDDEAEVLRVLRHELLHIVLAPFDALFDALAPLARADETRAEVLDSVRIFAVEQAVINLERMCRGLTAPPAAAGEGG